MYELCSLHQHMAPAGDLRMRFLIFHCSKHCVMISRIFWS